MINIYAGNLPENVARELRPAEVCRVTFRVRPVQFIIQEYTREELERGKEVIRNTAIQQAIGYYSKREEIFRLPWLVFYGGNVQAQVDRFQYDWMADFKISSDRTQAIKTENLAYISGEIDVESIGYYLIKK